VKKGRWREWGDGENGEMERMGRWREWGDGDGLLISGNSNETGLLHHNFLPLYTLRLSFITLPVRLFPFLIRTDLSFSSLWIAPLA